MKIVHYTSKALKNSIARDGLVFQKRDLGQVSDTLLINNVLNSRKPNHLPEAINRDKCIFFSFPGESLYEDDSSICIAVETKDLDLNSLYVADHSIAHKIWIHVSENQEIDNEFLNECALAYWNSLVPFDTYINSQYDYQDPEILYFKEVSPDIIDFSEEKNPVINRLMERIQETFDSVEREDSKTFTINFEGNKYSVGYFPRENKIVLTGYGVPVELKLVSIIEEAITYKTKEEVKVFGGRYNQLIYSNIKVSSKN